MPRIAILRFSHEGNSFNPIVTGATAFLRAEWLKAEEAQAAYRGTRTEMGAAVDFLASHPNWRGVFLRCAAAPPGGPVADALIDEVIGEAALDLSASRWDAVYVSLHGAMLGETRLTPDLDLLRAVRGAVGPACPIAATFDLHANMAGEIADVIDIAVGYKTYPHIDTYETAAKALDLLARAVAGDIRPAVTIARTGLVLLSHNMRTASGPMAEIEALAGDSERRGRFHDVTPFGGFSFGDTPHAGASVCITAERGDAAAKVAARARCREIRDRRMAFLPDMPVAADAVRNALASSDDGTVAIVEPADNPMSGGIGDTPGLFRALVDARPRAPSLFAFFCDPALLERARAAGEGGELEAALGGRLTAIYGPPVEARLRVVRLTDGRFVNDGPMWQGMAVDLGGSALFELTDQPMIRVIVTGACISPNDPAYFRLHGIDLADIRILAAKAKNHFRAAFAGACARIIDADTPGPATADLAALPFRHVPAAMLPPWPGLDDAHGAG